MKLLTGISGFFLSIIVISVLLTGCNGTKSGISEKDLPAGVRGIKVIEAIQTSNYTYIQAYENNETIWLAVNRMETKPGDLLYFKNSMEMKDFHSKELNRDFPSILFVQDITNHLVTMEETGKKSTGKIQVQRFESIKVEPAKDGITIGELFNNKDKYEGKKVKIRGTIVKFNANIMKKNWLHLQDGTKGDGSYDLTVTTSEIFSEGMIATFEGTVALNKDFGAGYAYDVLLEDASAIDVASAN